MRSVSVPRAVSMTIGTSRAAPQLAADVAAVAVGQREVEQHEVGRRSARRARSASAAVARPSRLEALALERLRERLGDRGSSSTNRMRGRAMPGMVTHRAAPGGRPLPTLCPGMTAACGGASPSWRPSGTPRVIAAVSAAGLLGAGAAAATRPGTPRSLPARPRASPLPPAPSPSVRTEVVRETVHRNRRAHPHQRRVARRGRRNRRAGRHRGRHRAPAAPVVTAVPSCRPPRARPSPPGRARPARAVTATTGPSTSASTSRAKTTAAMTESRPRARRPGPLPVVVSAARGLRGRLRAAEPPAARRARPGARRGRRRPPQRPRRSRAR